MSEPKLSVLIPAYNQPELLSRNIGTLLQNAAADFEIVVQDDDSEENLEELVRSFADARLVYKRNPVNLGHDRNVIEGFQNCRSQYVFLLRSSDTVLPGKIEAILSGIAAYPDLGYARFSCLDETGAVRIRYEDRYIEDRAETIALNRRILLHPSGELYNLRYLPERELKTIAGYLERYFQDRNRNVINELLRDRLSMTAPFALFSDVVWQYTRTAKRTDLAENRNRNGLSADDPRCLRERCRCELHYIVKDAGGTPAEKRTLLREVFAFYARRSIWAFRKINRDRGLQRHYGYKKRPFSSLRELCIFKNAAKTWAGELPAPYGDLLRKMAGRLGIKTIGYWALQEYFPRLARKMEIWSQRKH